MSEANCLSSGLEPWRKKTEIKQMEHSFSPGWKRLELNCQNEGNNYNGKESVFEGVDTPKLVIKQIIINVYGPENTV